MKNRLTATTWRALLSFPIVAAGCLKPADPNTAALLASARANQAAGMAPIAAQLATLKPIATVDAAGAPPPPGGPGFHCVEVRTERRSHYEARETMKTTSLCVRGQAACREQADRLAAERAGSDREFLHNTVGTCVAQPSAWCTVRSDDSGRTDHACAQSEDDCRGKLFTVTPPGGPTRQTACALMK